MGKFLDKRDGPLNAALREIEGALEDLTPGQRARLWGNIEEAAKLSPGAGRRAAMSRGYRRRGR